MTEAIDVTSYFLCNLGTLRPLEIVESCLQLAFFVKRIIWCFSLQIKPSTIEMKEGGVRLRLTIVDTPGFGDAVDNTDW